MYRGRARDYYDRLRGGDQVTQVIALAALIILIVIALPRLVGFLPYSVSGVDCLGLASPKLDGNHESVLASQVEPEVLKLELVPPITNISQGQPLNLEVRFINDSMAPLRLFLVPDMYLFRYEGRGSGLQFSITNTDRTATFGDPPNVRPSLTDRQQFAANELHILQPHQRCFVRVTIDQARLNAARMVQGDFLITAVYRNASRGVVPTPLPRTPTPIYQDQGAWVGSPPGFQVQSNESRVIIGAPPTLAPQ
jgi:hypothetical protein